MYVKKEKKSKNLDVRAVKVQSNVGGPQMILNYHARLLQAATGSGIEGSTYLDILLVQRRGRLIQGDSGLNARTAGACSMCQSKTFLSKSALVGEKKSGK